MDRTGIFSDRPSGHRLDVEGRSVPGLVALAERMAERFRQAIRRDFSGTGVPFASGGMVSRGADPGRGPRVGGNTPDYIVHYLTDRPGRGTRVGEDTDETRLRYEFARSVFAQYLVERPTPAITLTDVVQERGMVTGTMFTVPDERLLALEPRTGLTIRQLTAWYKHFVSIGASPTEAIRATEAVSGSGLTPEDLGGGFASASHTVRHDPRVVTVHSY